MNIGGFYMKIVTVKDKFDHRVSLVPELIKKLLKLEGTKVIVEKGLSDIFSDQDYIDAGASLMERDDALQNADIILGVSAGNEAVPEWNANLVSPGRVLYFVKELKKHVNVPVTYCDNNYYWKNQLTEVAKYVDFISIHIYPVWLGANVYDGIQMSIRELNEIKSLYPDKQIIITETGWPTNSNGGQIPKNHANESNQLLFNSEIDKYTENNGIICFFFEAFDEHWKGSDALDEPEKHWGYYYDDRTPKRIKS